MTDHAEIKDAMARFYAVRNAANLEETMNLLHEDITFRIAGCDQLGAFTEPVISKDAMQIAAVQLFAAWDLRGLRNVSVHAEADTICVHRKGTVRFIPTDTSFETEMIDKVTFKDGLIINFLHFVDTFRVAQVAGLQPA